MEPKENAATSPAAASTTSELADRYRYPQICFGVSVPQQSLDRDLWIAKKTEFNGSSKNLYLARLVPNRAITVNLDSSFLCDCHDIMTLPLAFRLHMYAGKSSEVPFATKLERMETWQKAILFFDSLMTVPSDATFERKVEGLLQFQLPRAEIAILSTGNPSLRKLFTDLGAAVHADPPRELIVRWENLVAVAKSGELVRRWLEQKGRSVTS